MLIEPAGPISPVQDQGGPRSALGGVVRPTSIRREPYTFEITFSSAPPTLSRLQEPIL